MHHFVGNNDKSCLMDANGKTTVVTSGEKKKTEIFLVIVGSLYNCKDRFLFWKSIYIFILVERK